jgi:HPt (histidine-containing phosphotransfer) domain-containing protein
MPITPVPETSAIDSEAINNLRELNPGDGGAFLREIIAIYIEDTPKRIEDLKTSMAAGDVALFTRSAHTIKGSSANVGAFVLKGVAERMESLSRREGLKSMPTMVADCEAEFTRAATELRGLIA